MKTGLTKKQKVTEVFCNAKDPAAEIYTHDTKLKKRLLSYAAKYPELCKQADDDGQGGLWFEIAKERISIRLTAPYSQERREVASKPAKENNICAIITSTLVVSILNAQLTIFFMIASLVQIPKCVVVLCEYVIHVV